VVSRNPPSGAGSDPVAGGLARDDAPAEPIAAVTASLLAGIAEARSPLAAGLVLFLLTFVVNVIARIVIERQKAFTE